MKIEREFIENFCQQEGYIAMGEGKSYSPH